MSEQSSLLSSHSSVSEEEESDDNTENGALSYETILHRHGLFQKAMEYKPNSKVDPKGTYLAILIHDTNNGLYLQTRFWYKEKDPEDLCFTKVQHNDRIPCPMNGFMSYCIAALDHRDHGTIHIGSEQETWFKESTSHIKDVVILEEGANFEDERLGIRVKDEDVYLQGF
jgi:hypothetical protein